jgi:hypothetical protein
MPRRRKDRFLSPEQLRALVGASQNERDSVSKDSPRKTPTLAKLKFMERKEDDENDG